jgi:hypothetical protein
VFFCEFRKILRKKPPVNSKKTRTKMFILTLILEVIVTKTFTFMFRNLTYCSPEQAMQRPL